MSADIIPVIDPDPNSTPLGLLVRGVHEPPISSVVIHIKPLRGLQFRSNKLLPLGFECKWEIVFPELQFC
jgi:hypothetical protein